MDISEIKTRKAEAEKQIADILQNLQDETTCQFSGIDVSLERLTIGTDKIVIQVGGSLTFTSEKDSRKWEKNGALPIERFKTLEILHLEGIRTWASMEPVIYPDQSLEIMEITKDYIDGYKVGKLNHFQNHEKKFDWNQFLKDTVEIMRKNDKLFYIKEDLRKFKTDDIELLSHEVDMDFMALKQWRNSETRKAREFNTI